LGSQPASPQSQSACPSASPAAFYQQLCGEIPPARLPSFGHSVLTRANFSLLFCCARQRWAPASAVLTALSVKVRLAMEADGSLRQLLDVSWPLAVPLGSWHLETFTCIALRQVNRADILKIKLGCSGALAASKTPTVMQGVGGPPHMEGQGRGLLQYQG
jgi:hypothetical protein